MTLLEEIEQVIIDNNITVIKTPDISYKTIIMEFINVFIGMNENLMSDNTDKVIALSHELGHYNTGGLYSVKLPYVNAGKIEYEADVDSVKRILPSADILDAIKHGCYSLWEISEHVNFPCEFVEKAIKIYQKKGELPFKFR